MKIKQGDMVVVIAGDNATETPHRVVQVLDNGRKVQVEGINRVFKHVKRGHPRSPQGGRLQLDMPIDSSNVQFYCESCSKGVRLAYRYTEDGAKERYCRSCQATISQISPPRAAYARKA